MQPKHRHCQDTAAGKQTGHHISKGMIKDEEVYKIGRVGKTHGIHGEVQVQIDDDVFDRVDAEYLILRIDGILVPFFMDEYRFKNDDIALVKFSDINSNEQARRLTGCEVFFQRAIADAEEHDMTYAELVGYSVVNSADNTVLGEIEYVDDATDNILFELTDGTLIPAAEELIAEIDSENRRIAMIIPEGLI